ncbi:MAG: VWA domain-containing protein [Flavobacteriales bacterium]|nr:VWA domain-containing protein [Flavobacteriales bacterium]MCB0784686.1 VWA domain-containing protein [Flavobacteriales bacterium]
MKNSEDMSMEQERGTHILVLLDRSGSMAAIADDVIGGFNQFLEDQLREGPDARITLVQFDSVDAQEFVMAGSPIADARPLTRQTYVPRGGTPLLDATAKLIEHGRAAEAQRAMAGLPQERIVFVSITDGQENQSREHDLAQVKGMIRAREEQGWVFVFLSAALDAYGDALRLGINAGSIQGFEHSREGVHQAMNSLSRKLVDFRRGRVAPGPDGFFGKDKPAEAHRSRKTRK